MASGNDVTPCNGTFPIFSRVINIRAVNSKVKRAVTVAARDSNEDYVR